MIQFTEAATVPLAAMTSAIGLYNCLGLPEPWRPVDPNAEPTPLIIYGAGSAVGAFAVQLASRSNIHPLICVAGRSADHVQTLIDPSKGDVIIDYRAGDEAVVSGLAKALGGKKALHALDAVSENGSYQNINKVLSNGAKLTVVLPGKEVDAAREGVEVSRTSVGTAHKEAKDFAFVSFRLFGRGLAEGWFKPHRHEVVPGGLGGVQTALENLKAGKASAVKYVFRIAETEGATGK